MVETTERGPNGVYQPPASEIAGAARTRHYTVVPFGPAFTNYLNRPWFTLAMAEAMLWDQQVWFGLQLGNAPLMSAEVEFKSRSPVLQKWAQETWESFWQRFASDIFMAKYFGYAGFEVCYCLNPRTRLYEIDRLRSFHPKDVRPLVQGGNRNTAGKIAGCSVFGARYRQTSADDRAPTRLFGMKGLWLTFGQLYSSNYGRAATEKAYPAWWDKAMPGGAYDLRRLRGVKDAWVGDLFKYPSDKILTLPDGTEISAKDAVRELGENRASGGMLAVPSDHDEQGNPLFEYQPPTTIADSSVIKTWLDDLDNDIFDGLLVPKEVVEAAASGSGFSGRSIPMIMFLALRDTEFGGYVRPIVEQVLQPLGIMNFGRFGDDFEAKPKKLVDTLSDSVGGGPAGGPIGASHGGQAPPGGRFGGGPQQAEGPAQTHQFSAWGGGWTDVELIADRAELIERVKSAGANREALIAAFGDADAAQRYLTRRAGGAYLVDAVIKAMRWDVQFSADFESKHPRADDGKFGDKGGGTATAEKPDYSKAVPRVIKGTAPAKKKTGPAPGEKQTRESKVESLSSVVARTSEEWGIDPKRLREAINFVAEEHFAVLVEREDAKLSLRNYFGVSSADVHRLENAGYDSSNAWKAPGVIGARFKAFDEKAQQAARLFPTLGLGDPDDKAYDFAPAVWDALREGSKLRRFGKQGWEQRKTDPAVVQQAAKLVYFSQKFDEQRGEAYEGDEAMADPEGLEDVPFSLEDQGIDPVLWEKWMQFSTDPPLTSSKERLAKSSLDVGREVFDPLTRRLERLLKKS